MTDVITRFKLETTQYDSKLRDAAKGLKEISHMAELGGKGFKEFTQKQVEAARAFGQVESGANNLKDKVKDLVGSFNDAAKAYNALTKEQQQTDFGKALAESLTTLKGRITEAKQELYGLADAAGGGGIFGGGKLDGMLQVFGGNLMTKGFELATGAAMTFVNTIKDAAAQGIEMAKSGEGIRNAFERLNEPGLLDNLREATHGTVTNLELMKAAVKFNDFKLPVEELGTMLAFAQQKAKDTGQSVDYMVDSIVTGLGRKSLMILDNLGLSATEIKEKMKKTGDMTKAVGEIIREQMASAGDYVETAADRATKADVDLKNAMEELGRTLLPLQEQGVGMWNALEIGAIKLLNEGITPLVPALINLKETIGGIAESISNTSIFDGYVSALGAVADKATEMIPGLGKVYMLLKAIRGNGSNDMGAGVGAAISGAISANAGVLPDVVITPTEKTTTDKGGGSTTSINDKVLTGWLNASNKSALGADSLKPEILGPSDVWKAYTEDIRSGLQGVDTEMTNLTQWTKNFDAFSEALKKEEKRAKQVATAQNLAAESVANLGAAFAALDDPGAKAAGTVLQAIASIALGFASASKLAGELGPFGWLAWLGAGTAALATTISTVHSLTGYAEGGMVQGNTYSGDQIPAMLNAGEVVLNKAQQGAIASQLSENGGGGGGYVPSSISGEQIFIAMNRYTRRTGKGEIVTWK